MTAYHATHPSPYADDCPDCAGYPDIEADYRERRRMSAVVLLACFAALLALALVAAWR